jgi:hypothetical protein
MNESLIRGISATLSLLDRSLSEFEQWGRGEEVCSALYEIKNTLSPDQRQAILEEVAQMREVLLELRDTLHLEKLERSVLKLISTSCTVSWISLVELQPKHLRRYGKIPPGLSEFLDPRVAILIERLHRIDSIAGGRHVALSD